MKHTALQVMDGIFSRLSAHDRTRLMEILDQHPEFLADLIESYRAKQSSTASAVLSSEKRALQKLIQKT